MANEEDPELCTLEVSGATAKIDGFWRTWACAGAILRTDASKIVIRHRVPIERREISDEDAEDIASVLPLIVGLTHLSEFEMFYLHIAVKTDSVRLFNKIHGMDAAELPTSKEFDSLLQVSLGLMTRFENVEVTCVSEENNDEAIEAAEDATYCCARNVKDGYVELHEYDHGGRRRGSMVFKAVHNI